jgi:sec-independent protein translocase protein TatA
MGGLSIWHWLVVGVIILLLFGKGRFSEMMGDVAKGLKSFKKGMSEEDAAHPPARAEPPRLSDAGTVDATAAERTREAEAAAERREP